MDRNSVKGDNMGHNYLFEDDDLEDARLSLKNVSLIEEQSKIVDSLLNIALKSIHIDELALRGFFMMAIQEWQQKRELRIGDLRSLSPAVRKKFVAEMFQELEKILLQILRKKEDYAIIQDAIEQSYQTYVQDFADRPMNPTN